MSSVYQYEQTEEKKNYPLFFAFMPGDKLLSVIYDAKNPGHSAQVSTTFSFEFLFKSLVETLPSSQEVLACRQLNMNLLLHERTERCQKCAESVYKQAEN